MILANNVLESIWHPIHLWVVAEQMLAEVSSPPCVGLLELSYYNHHRAVSVLLPSWFSLKTGKLSKKDEICTILINVFRRYAKNVIRNVTLQRVLSILCVKGTHWLSSYCNYAICARKRKKSLLQLYAVSYMELTEINKI